MIISCPHCGAAIDAPAGLSGQVASCPHCNQAITIPVIATLAPPPIPISPPPRRFRKVMLDELKTNSLVQVGAVMVIFVIGMLIWSAYSGYRDRVIAEKAETARVERVIYNTPIIWNQYREIEMKNSAMLSLNQIQSIRLKGESMRKLLDYDIDSDLRAHIQARVNLIFTGLGILDEAIAEAKKLESRRNTESFFAGVLGGMAVPDNPVAAGAVFGRAAYANGQGAADALASRIEEAIQAVKAEDKKLDEYQNTLRSLLVERYKTPSTPFLK